MRRRAAGQHRRYYGLAIQPDEVETRALFRDVSPGALINIDCETAKRIKRLVRRHNPRRPPKLGPVRMFHDAAERANSRQRQGRTVMFVTSVEVTKLAPGAARRMRNHREWPRIRTRVTRRVPRIDVRHGEVRPPPLDVERCNCPRNGRHITTRARSMRRPFARFFACG